MFRPVQVYMVFRTHSAFHDVASYRPTRLAYFALSIIQAYGGRRSTALPFFSYFAVTAFRMVLHVIDFRAQLVPRDLLREQHLSS